MDSVTLGSVLDSIARGSPIVILLLTLLYGGVKRWWVFGWTYVERIRDLEGRLAAKDAEIATWRNLTLKAAGITGGLADVVQQRQGGSDPT